MDSEEWEKLLKESKACIYDEAAEARKFTKHLVILMKKAMEQNRRKINE